MCWFLSIFGFLGLGFFLHMQLFEEDAVDVTGSGMTAPTLRPSGDGNSTTGDGSVAAGNYPPTSSPILTYSPTTPSPTTLPSTIPSFAPTTTPYPSSSPTAKSSSFPSSSIQPSHVPSDAPSIAPTGIPGCPEQLLKTATLDDEGLIMMKYDVVIYQNDEYPGGGLLCASVEYNADNPAAWIGLAFSEAKRDPAFGRKEAIIGLPGIRTSTPVATGGTAALGQQVGGIGGPSFANPAKYIIPAGGIGDDAYSGPNLRLLSDIDKQTLINGSVSIVDPYTAGGLVTTQSKMRTQMSFAKYLEEDGEIEIDPFGSTLLLYAVSVPLDDGSGEYDSNPDWKSTFVTFLDGSDVSVMSGQVRTRQHENENNS